MTPTAIPDNLSIVAPEIAEAGATFQFKTSISSTTGLRFEWNFGDGNTSTLAAPSHVYAAGGEFDVQLKVSNEGGVGREVKTKVSVSNLPNVRGLECSKAQFAGWCWQSPKPTGNEVTVVRFVDALNGWRGDAAGDVFRTVDGGATWQRQRTGTKEAVRALVFQDRQTGWAVFAGGAVLRTVDAGVSWLPSQISGVMGLRALSNQVVLAGTGGSTSRSDDGGATWRQLPMPVHAVSSSSVLWSTADGVVYRSDDRGESFKVVLRVPNTFDSLIESASLLSVSDLHLVYFAWKRTVYPESMLVYFVPHVYTTVDGGKSWSMAIATGLPDRTGTPMGSEQLTLRSASDDGRTLIASSNAEPWRSLDGGKTWTSALPPGQIAAGTITLDSKGASYVVNLLGRSSYLTEDGGQTWEKLSLPSGVQADVARIGGNVFEATDHVGNKYISADRSKSWSQVHEVPLWRSSDASLVSFRDARNGFMFRNGERGLSSDELLATVDGGLSWTKQGKPWVFVQSLQFVSADVGWLLAGIPTTTLFKTVDGGKVWTAVATSVARVRFDTARLGWMQRQEAYAVTTDGGQSWRDVALPPGVTALAMADEAWMAYGFAGRYVAYVSKDQGKTWAASGWSADQAPQVVKASGGKVFWAAGPGGVMKSEDGGMSWSSAVAAPNGSQSMRDMAFANANVGWIVGDRGLLLATKDGGKSWQLQDSGTHRNLVRIQVMDAKTAWISGDYGTLLATVSGGD